MNYQSQVILEQKNYRGGRAFSGHTDVYTDDGNGSPPNMSAHETEVGSDSNLFIPGDEETTFRRFIGD